ncbi:MAG: acyl-CoA synthetase [Nocardiaceae bacterium]|nr:acyl-CoA synthetase [Nocardiaceae bacterium]
MKLAEATKRSVDELYYVMLCARAGLLKPIPPHRLAAIGLAVQKFGGVGGLAQLAAARYPKRPALIDELGSLTFHELDQRTNALANAWRAKGLRSGQSVAILVRNHRGFHYSVFAAAKCGARIVLLNTDFAGPQLREVLDREGAEVLVYDEEYAPLLGGIEPRCGAYLAWTSSPGPNTLDGLIAAHPTRSPRSPHKKAKIVLLTSGTTGTPKGASRGEPHSLSPIGTILSKVPFKTGEITECPAPLFHTLGFAHALLAVGLGSTLVIRRRFDPKAVMESLRTNGATAMIAVPVMLQRLVDSLPDERQQTKLRIIFVAGSQLGAPLCQRVTRVFGPVIYNLYGSTEVAYATIATPDDLASEPGCVGKPVHSAVVKIFDGDGKEVTTGTTGRIFVGNDLQFEGYTGGGDKQRIAGLMSSGDVGHFDSSGRLFIDGRDDDMIISGGENVFPGEIEELLAAHPAVLEVSAIGIDDETYGQRLCAFIVRRDGVTLSEDDVRDYVRAHLARFKVPRDVVFVDLLPRNPTGKVLKRELRVIAAGRK